MDIRDEYFEWIVQEVSGSKYSLLLDHLHSIPFVPHLYNDDNRIDDGLVLRDIFANHVAGISPEIMKTKFRGINCSVLEMIFGLAFRMEHQILGDDDFGVRTSVWFWKMIDNIGIRLDNNKYNEKIVDSAINDLIERKYEKDGTGGLFKSIHGEDMRTIPIWTQMCLFCNELL